MLSRHDAEEFLRAFKLARTYSAAGLPAPAIPEERRTLRKLWYEYAEELQSMGRSKAHQRNVDKASRPSEPALTPEHPVPLTRDALVTLAKYARERTKTQGDAVL